MDFLELRPVLIDAQSLSNKKKAISKFVFNFNAVFPLSSPQFPLDPFCILVCLFFYFCWTFYREAICYVSTDLYFIDIFSLKFSVRVACGLYFIERTEKITYKFIPMNNFEYVLFFVKRKIPI